MNGEILHHRSRESCIRIKFPFLSMQLHARVRLTLRIYEIMVKLKPRDRILKKYLPCIHVNTVLHFVRYIHAYMKSTVVSLRFRKASFTKTAANISVQSEKTNPPILGCRTNHNPTITQAWNQRPYDRFRDFNSSRPTFSHRNNLQVAGTRFI